MAPSPVIPPHTELAWPTLQAVRELGGSGSIDEINAQVIKSERFTEEQQSVLHGDGPQSEIDYRLAWSHTYLKGAKLLDNSARGIWTVTDKGRTVGREEIPGLLAQYTRQLRETREAKRRGTQRAAMGLTAATASDSEQLPAGERDWKQELLEALLVMSPKGFEELAQRLLREAGFTKVAVTGRSGDGGIDVTGVQRVSLISFPVYVQCKRYRGSVGPGEVRDFRGAMIGRGDKGLLIATGSFTSQARQEATRDGAPPIDLVDGEELCDLLKQYRIGVETTMVEHVTVHPEFFAHM